MNFTFQIISPKNGTHAVIAPSRFRDEIMKYGWCLVRNKTRAAGRQLRVSAKIPGGHGGSIFLHRLIWFLSGRAPCRLIDHIDGDSLNNSEGNLRSCNDSENQRNRRSLHKFNKSGVSGVCRDTRSGRWRADIRAEGRKICLGQFDTIEAAKAARAAGVEKYHGEFGVLP